MHSSDIEDIVKGFEDLDWDLAIRRNRDQLRQIVLALFALAGLSSPPRMWGRGARAAGGEGDGRRRCAARAIDPVNRLQTANARSHATGWVPLFLPRSTVALIMAVLRPAESAVRRLIVIVAQGLKLSTITDLVKQPGDWLFLSPTERGGEVPSACEVVRGSYRTFPLFDPLKSFDPDSIWDTEPAYQSDYSFTKSIAWHDASADQTPVDSTHLAHRLNAILRALNDLPRQARRLKRWELKRDDALKASKPTRLSPMRPGLPPGWRERKVHEIDDVLKECHRLANDRVNDPDSS